MLSLLMMVALTVPVMARAGKPETEQSAGAVSTAYTVEFTYDGISM